MIINCPDSVVRNTISRTVLHSINIMIQFYDIQLDLD